jgi:hypothetical protein
MNVATEVQPKHGQVGSHLNARWTTTRATAFLALWIASFPFIFPAIMVTAAFTASLIFGSPVKATADQAITSYRLWVSIFLHLLSSWLH